MTTGRPEERRETLTAPPWVMKESGTGAVQGGVRDGRSNTGKSPSAAADEAGARGRHGARPAQGGKKGGRQEKTSGKTSGVQGDNRGREASRVAHESPGVGDEEGGREASGVAENSWGPPQSGQGSRLATGRRHHRSGRGARGDKPPRGPTATEVGLREYKRGGRG